MKTQLKAQLLQHLISKKKENEGFTLIELLVVIIIIGILSAIALPAFLNQANRARQSEAVTYVGSINRAQQAYRLENRTFADSVNDLGLGVQTSTEFYVYGSSNDAKAATEKTNRGSTVSFTDSAPEPYSSGAAIYAMPLDPVLLGYGGATYTLQLESGDATTTAILCTSKTAGAIGDVDAAKLGTDEAKVGFADTKEDACKVP